MADSNWDRRRRILTWPGISNRRLHLSRFISRPQSHYCFPGEAYPSKLPATAASLENDWVHGHTNAQGEVQRFEVPDHVIPTFRESASYGELKLSIKSALVCRLPWWLLYHEHFPVEQVFESADGFPSPSAATDKSRVEQAHFCTGSKRYDSALAIQLITTLHTSAGRKYRIVSSETAKGRPLFRETALCIRIFEALFRRTDRNQCYGGIDLVAQACACSSFTTPLLHLPQKPPQSYRQHPVSQSLVSPVAGPRDSSLSAFSFWRISPPLLSNISWLTNVCKSLQASICVEIPGRIVGKRSLSQSLSIWELVTVRELVENELGRSLSASR